MNRVVFDTNFWLSVFISSKPDKLFLTILLNRLDVFGCELQAKELQASFYSKKIYKKKLHPPFAQYIQLYYDACDIVDVHLRLGLIHDYKDAYLWNLCTQVKADILVTNDLDFDILKTYKRPPIRVITAAEFWNYFEI